MQRLRTYHSSRDDSLNEGKHLYYVTYQEHRRGGAPVDDPDDRWSREDLEIEVSLLAVHKTDPATPESVAVASDLEIETGNSVHVVLSRYSDGDTFGTNYGNWMIHDLFTDRALADLLCSHLYKLSDRRYEYSTTFEGRKYSVSWAGYFSRFESVSVKELPVHP